MERVFTRNVGRYNAGDVKDWPLSTWKSFFRNFERISKPVGEVIQAAMNGKPKTRRRKRPRKE